MSDETRNTVGDADLNYLGAAKDRLAEGFTPETPPQHRFKDIVPYEASLDAPPDTLAPYDGAEWVDPENTENGGFLERPGFGYKPDVKRG